MKCSLETGTTCALSEVPISQAENRPWVNINQTNAIDRCRAIGSGFDLISDQQWMVLAENILNTPINDLDASDTGGPNLARGHSDNISGASLQAISISGNTNFDVSVSLDHPDNANCVLRTQGYEGTGYNWDQAYGSGREQLRTHMLSNGEIIWDVAGNVWSWVLGDYFASVNNTDLEYSDVPDFSGIEWVRPSQLLPISNGVGKISTVFESTSVVRGGYWINGDNVGVFYVIADDSDPSEIYMGVGFRCVYFPGG